MLWGVPRTPRALGRGPLAGQRETQGARPLVHPASAHRWLLRGAPGLVGTRRTLRLHGTGPGGLEGVCGALLHPALHGKGSRQG